MKREVVPLKLSLLCCNIVTILPNGNELIIGILNQNERLHFKQLHMENIQETFLGNSVSWPTNIKNA